MAENTAIHGKNSNPPEKGYCYLPHSKFPVPVTILSNNPSKTDMEGKMTAIKLENIFDTVNFLSWLKETNISIIDEITSTDVIIIPSNWIIQSFKNLLDQPANSTNSQNVSPKVGDYAIWTKGFTLVQIDSVVTENNEVDLTVSRCAEGELTTIKFEERKLISLKIDPDQLLPLSELTKLQAISEQNRDSVAAKQVEWKTEKVIMLEFQPRLSSTITFMPFNPNAQTFMPKPIQLCSSQGLSLGKPGTKKNKQPKSKSAETPTSSGTLNDTEAKNEHKDGLKPLTKPEKIHVYGNCYMKKWEIELQDVSKPEVISINDKVIASAGGYEKTGRVKRICKIISELESATEVVVGIQFKDPLTSLRNFIEISHSIPNMFWNCKDCVNNRWIFIRLHVLLNKENGVFLLQRPRSAILDDYSRTGVADFRNKHQLAIQIRTLDGKTFPIEAMTLWSVRKLKEEIKKLTGNQTDNCLLQYKAKKLADDDILSSYNILPESIIHANFST